MALDLTSLADAIQQLEQVVARTNDAAYMSQQDEISMNLIRSGVIQHFEVAFELSWKFMQRWLRENVSTEDADFPRSRKELFRLAARHQLIEDPTTWFSYSDARNITSHTYNKAEADKVYQQAAPLLNDAKYLLQQLEASNNAT